MNNVLLDVEEKEQTMKIIILGDSQVGKTTILNRYIDNKFNENYVCTIGVDFRVKHLILENKRFCANLWDTAGQERFKSITKQFYQNLDGIMICFDLSNKNSIETIHEWIGVIRSDIFSHLVPIVLIGTKCDLQINIDYEKIVKIMNQYEIKYFETSSKTGKNVQECFLDLFFQAKNFMENILTSSFFKLTPIEGIDAEKQQIYDEKKKGIKLNEINENKDDKDNKEKKCC